MFADNISRSSRVISNSIYNKRNIDAASTRKLWRPGKTYGMLLWEKHQINDYLIFISGSIISRDCHSWNYHK